MELYRRIRQLRPDVVGVFVTGFPTIDTVYPAIAVGVERVIAKPAGSNELIDVIEEFVGKPLDGPPGWTSSSFPWGDNHDVEKCLSRHGPAVGARLAQAWPGRGRPRRRRSSSSSSGGWSNWRRPKPASAPWSITSSTASLPSTSGRRSTPSIRRPSGSSATGPTRSSDRT